MYGAADIDESLACLDEAVKLGVDHWDVAEIYGRGLCEEIIGRYLAGNPAPVVIATKGGIYRDPEPGFRNDRASLRASLEGSLKRLGRDRVELYYVHRREPERPIEEVVETLVGFIEEGLIGAYGLSEVAPGTIRRASAVHPVAAVQNEYSIWTRMVELGVRQACAEVGATLVAFSPVGRGIFADRYPERADFPEGDIRLDNPRFLEPNFSLNKSAIEPFRALCRARGWPVAAAAVAWTLDQGDDVLPIPGTRSAGHLRELAQGAEIAFSDEDRAEIARILPPGFAHGARYPDRLFRSVEQYC